MVRPGPSSNRRHGRLITTDCPRSPLGIPTALGIWLREGAADEAIIQREGLEPRRGRGVETADERFIQGAVLGLRVPLILADGGVVSPARDLAEAGGHAAGAVFALVAVDQEGVVSLVQHQFDDRGHGLRGSEDVGVFVGEDRDVVVGDAVLGHEGRVGGWNPFRHEGDDGFEAVELQLVEVGSLWVTAAVDAWADCVEIGGQAGSVGRWRLGLVFFHRH